MSYIASNHWGLGALTAGTIVQSQAGTASPTTPAPGPGYVWVLPTVDPPRAGYWRRALPGEAGVTAEKAGITVVTEHAPRPGGVEDRTNKMRAECIASGMPPELVAECVRRAIAAGGRHAKPIIEQMFAEHGIKKTPWLLYGALGLGAIGLYWFMRRRSPRGESE